MLLSFGGDGVPKLWDVASGNLLLDYPGRSSDVSSGRGNATFSWNEEYVICAEERPMQIMVWCSRTGKLIDRLSGHNSPVNHLAYSPTEDTFMSCGQDNRARLWTSSE